MSASIRVRRGASRAATRRARREVSGPPGAPLIIVLGGISATAHVTATASDPTPGWWQDVVGPDRAIDTRRFRVASIDWLDPRDDESDASPCGPPEERPSRHPEGRPSCHPEERQRRRIPLHARSGVITTHEQATALATLLDDLGVERARAVIGASYGGMVALAFAERHAARLEQLVVIGAAHESHPPSTGLRALQRRIVALGLETGRPTEALALARALAITTYRTPAELTARFGPVVPEETDDGITFAVERWLMHHGEAFARGFDAERYVALSLSADLHRVDPSRITVPTLLVAADDDALVPREQMDDLARRIAGPCRVARLETRAGHDGFLAEPDRIGRILSTALHAPVTP